MGAEAEDDGSPPDGGGGAAAPGVFTSSDLLDKLQDPEQRRLLREMMAAFEGPEEVDDEDGRGLYHDTGCLLRYLRARKWDIEAAKEMLRKTGRWRKSFDFAGIVGGKYVEAIARENDSGKIFVRGYDKRGRPALYMRPRNEHSSDNEAILLHLVYCVARAVRCIDHQKEQGKLLFDPTDANCGKFVLCVDFADFGMRNMIPLSVAREFISILQDHFPERLGQAFIVDAPWIFNTLWNAVKVFIDPVTMEKIQFVNDEGEERSARFAATFDLAVLEPAFGGTATEPFESHIFMSCKKNGTEFGLEYNEQVALFEEETAEAKHKAAADRYSLTSNADHARQQPINDAPLVQAASFWGVSSDERVLALSRKERGLVRELARLLACQVDEAHEDHTGLFNDAGALIRYLRAEAWSPLRAETRIRATARWRKEFCFAAQRSGAFAEAIARQCASGKMYVRGFDRRGRPIVYVKLDVRDSRRHEDFLRLLVYCVERALACLELEQRISGSAMATEDSGGKLTVVVDFAGYGGRNRPPLRSLKEAISILQDHYPERLGEAYLFFPPLKVRLFWKLVRRLVRPSTYQQVVIVRDAKHQERLLDAVFDRATLERSVGGERDVPFDSNVFLRRTVNGEVYGAEFEAQLAAREPRRTVLWADDLNLPLKEENEDGCMGWAFSLDGIFGGSGGR